jgi:hypothetical protein
VAVGLERTVRALYNIYIDERRKRCYSVPLPPPTTEEALSPAAREIWLGLRSATQRRRQEKS